MNARAIAVEGFGFGAISIAVEGFLIGGFPVQFFGLKLKNLNSILDLCLVAEADASTGMGGVIKILKGGVNYSLYLVETDDSNASPIRVKTSVGIKSIRLKT